ncbi:hypothetical protein N7489_001085 [Penicillium chrysogenum]|uniref:uncharacterized protein n=1 Tax=Penicillium chrysogenum TaxID=5076 RepID=UPI0024DF1B6D|nr:uncharacterized protein N7489_001085 [Penicillium chrysogenum]KAJ5250675.1 hypothetical protein N7489_001085 [Penicillium chrysogenum]
MEFESSPAPSRRSSENVNNSSSALLPTADNASRPNDTPALEARSVLTRLYISHTLSTWNSRMFEFGAVLFLASNFPGTLLYASIYALVRAFSAVALSSWLGAQVDHSDRLVAVRHSIVTLSTDSWALTIGLFAVQGLLACMEKLAATANTVAVERDWAIVISNSINVPRQDLNASMRRIDLFCKLLAPVFISLIDSISTRYAIWTVFTLNTASVLVEYMAIAQVYQSVPALTKTQAPTTQADDINNESDDAHHSASPKVLHSLSESLAPWKEYIASPVFLASLALSLLYLTVLSFGATMVTYLLSTGFTSLQFACVAAAAVPFVAWDSSSRFVAGTLIAGVALSRVGLWGFDLSVQFLVQENIQEHARARFSATEMALQNVFEMLSFASTIAFPLPAQFVYPVMISSGAVAVAAVCFAAYVRKERGHLLHRSRCMGGDKAPYQAIGSGSVVDV